jgi:hypothetical protein
MSQEDIRISEIQANTHIARGQENRKMAETYLRLSIQAILKPWVIHCIPIFIIGRRSVVNNRASFLEIMRKVVSHRRSRYYGPLSFRQPEFLYIQPGLRRSCGSSSNRQFDDSSRRWTDQKS